jgi:hypothetical protein
MHRTAGVDVMSAGIDSPATTRPNRTFIGSVDVHESRRLRNVG